MAQWLKSVFIAFTGTNQLFMQNNFTRDSLLNHSPAFQTACPTSCSYKQHTEVSFFFIQLLDSIPVSLIFLIKSFTLLFCYCIFIFMTKLSSCSPGKPRTHSLPASASPDAGVLKGICIATSQFITFFEAQMFLFLLGRWYTALIPRSGRERQEDL